MRLPHQASAQCIADICLYRLQHIVTSLDVTAFVYSSSRNTRDFSREIRAQSEIWLHREYNLAMKNKSLRRIADMRSGRRLRAAHVAARTPRRS